MNKDINAEDLQKINHKILFFFMPENIVFFKKNEEDTDQTAKLKDIFPNFYWCSAHEFADPSFEKKYLIQYQIYSIENNDIRGERIDQFWASSKNEIRLHLISFLERWNDHKRLLLSSAISETKIVENKNKLLAESGSGHKQNFLEFASFVARSIFNFKALYLQQAQSGGFELQQKEFWKNAAFHYMDVLKDQLKNNKNNNKTKAAKTKKDKPERKKSKNETK